MNEDFFTMMAKRSAAAMTATREIYINEISEDYKKETGNEMPEALQRVMAEAYTEGAKAMAKETQIMMEDLGNGKGGVKGMAGKR